MRLKERVFEVELDKIVGMLNVGKIRGMLTIGDGLIILEWRIE